LELASLVAIGIFTVQGAIAWQQNTLVLVGSLVGGYFAARYSRLLPPQAVRLFVIIASSGTTLYFFWHT